MDRGPWIEIELAEWGRLGHQPPNNFEAIRCRKSEQVPDTITVEVVDAIVGGIRMRDVIVNKHNAAILKMIVYDATFPQGMTKYYAKTQDSQCTAAVDLMRALKEQKPNTGEKDVSSKLGGPRRLEVTLQALDSSGINSATKPILVTDFSEHAGVAISGKTIQPTGQPQPGTI